MNPSATADVHLVQMWVVPDTEGIDPGYEERDVNDLLSGGDLVPVASGRGHDGALTLHQRDAVLWAGRLAPTANATVPDAPHVHAFIASGDVELDGAGHLDQGDAVRLTGAGARTIVAGASGAELLVWETA
jgi:redox-sensitive bicupin YhaK (pirin superfamily)